MLFNLTTLLSAQSEWGFSQFFHDKNKTGYEVSLQAYSRHTSSWTNHYPLSNEDAKTLIDILSAYNWEEYRITRTDELMTQQELPCIYYTQVCIITITHPDKRKVILEINNGGVERDEYLIRYPNGKLFGALRLHARSYLSSNDIKRVKQLFFENNINFNNVTFRENGTVKIMNNTSFPSVFSLELPTVFMDTTLSKQFINLYNLGWDNGSSSACHHSDPVYSPYLFNNTMTISFGNASLNLSYIDFSDENRQMLEGMINNTLAVHYGEGEKIMEHQRLKIYYQYKNGLLHGEVKIYTLDGKLTKEFEYDNGLPVLLITYTAKGIKEKEFHFIPSEMRLTWIEYDELERVKDIGKSSYQQYNFTYKDLRNLYKTSK